MPPKIVSKVKCAECNNEVTVSDSKVTSDGVFVCTSCLKDYFKCDKCDDIQHNSHKITAPFEIDGVEYLCSDCAEDMDTCYCCGIIVEQATTVNNHKYCESCMKDECSPCPSCGVVTEDSVLERGLCPTCAIVVNPSSHLPPMCRRRYLTKRCFNVSFDFSTLAANGSGWVRQEHDNLIKLTSPMLRGRDGIENIRTSLRSIRAEVNRNCTFGIGIDFSSQTEEDVLKFLMVSIAMQEWAGSVVARSRNNNTNCALFPRDMQIQLADSKLDEWLYGTSRNKLLKASYVHPSALYWVDIHSFYNRGLVGINLHQGTKNTLKVLRWIELWLKTAEWSIKQRTSTIKQKFLEPDWYQNVLTKIGVRASTTSYFNDRATSLARPRRSR
jgi:hypothetical protein